MTPKEEDVIIIHDSLFKDISEGLLKNEKLTVKKVWTAGVRDAHEYVLDMRHKPKVVILHSDTNDLKHLSELEIVDYFMKIQDILESRNINMLFSYIAPRLDSKDFNAKALVINALIDRRCCEKENVTISRHDNFYPRGVIDSTLYEQDGIHLNGKKEGPSLLANNTKEAVCRILGIEIAQPHRKPKQPLNEHFRKQRSSHQGL